MEIVSCHMIRLNFPTENRLTSFNMNIELHEGLSFLFKKNIFILFIYFWLRWVFVAACGLSLLAASGGLLFVAVHWPLIEVASLVAEHGLQACGLQ